MGKKFEYTSKKPNVIATNREREKVKRFLEIWMICFGSNQNIYVIILIWLRVLQACRRQIQRKHFEHLAFYPLTICINRENERFLCILFRIPSIYHLYIFFFWLHGQSTYITLSAHSSFVVWDFFELVRYVWHAWRGSPF